MMTQYELEMEAMCAAIRRASFTNGVFPRRKTIPPTTSALPLWPKQRDWLRGQGCVLNKDGDKYVLHLEGKARKWWNRQAIALALYGELVHDSKKTYVIFG